jgi:drug/metabolite transporter (DMT)-like permease
MVILLLSHSSGSSASKGSWSASLMLFIYAITFSFAYITLDTATGALILFGSVQITMILSALTEGQRLHASEWSGVLIAFAGFVYLVLPDITTPSIKGFVLMATAGIAWGFYTLKGKGSNSPLADTTFNFFRTLPLVALLVMITFPSMEISTQGILLAILSGAVASGIGYTIWYIALGGLTATQAAVLQLSVPVIAAAGGVVFVGESISLRLAVSAFIILSGILLVILGRYYSVQRKI